MRRAFLIVFCVLLAAVIWWRGGPPAGVDGAGNAAAVTGGGEEREFRIDIVDTAAEADARHQAILSRYAGDAEARAWVDGCLSEAGSTTEQYDLQRSWEFACWQSWDDLQQGTP